MYSTVYSLELDFSILLHFCNKTPVIGFCIFCVWFHIHEILRVTEVSCDGFVLLSDYVNSYCQPGSRCYTLLRTTQEIVSVNICTHTTFNMSVRIELVLLHLAANRFVLYLNLQSIFVYHCYCHNIMQVLSDYSSVCIHCEPSKRWQYICDHNSGKSWWISITFTYLETGINTLCK